jgi:protein phosphatase
MKIISLFSILIAFILSCFVLVYNLSNENKNKIKRFYYTYPNGIVGNAESKNLHFIGVNTLKDVKFPELNYETKDSEFDTKSTFIKILKDFSFYLLVCILIFGISIYALVYKADIYLFLIFFIFSIFLFANFLLLAFESFHFLFFSSFIFLSLLMINFSFRLKGEDYPIKLVFPEVCFSAAIASLGITDKTNPELFTNLIRVSLSIFILGNLSCLSVLLYDILKYKNETKTRVKKAILFVILLALFSFPSISFFYRIFLYFPNFYYFILSLFIISPILFILATYNYSILPEQLYFSSTLVIISTLASYILIYLVFVSLLNFIEKYLNIKNTELLFFVTLFFCIYCIVEVKLYTKKFVHYITFNRNKKLKQALNEITEIISTPFSQKNTFRKLVEKVKDTLEIKFITILVSSERFPDLNFKKIQLLEMRPENNVWKYLINQDDVIITSSLKYGSGVREEVYNFLKRLNVQLIFPMYGFDESTKREAFFMVGEKTTPKNFTLGEIRFIQECARLTDLIIHNYQLLIDDIQRKKMEKSLRAASIVEATFAPQKNFNPNKEETDIDYVSIPVAQISGDYIDFIELSKDEFAIFLGDVSGHGLGSGYLVSAIKALIRNQVDSKNFNLINLLSRINQFLIDRYSGNEFMTLIAGTYNLSTGQFEFINAGHMPPIIAKKNGAVELAKGSNRILGVLKTNYSTQKIVLEKGDRLVLYTDGITETFNPRDEIFGEGRLKKLLAETIQMDAKELTNKLKLELDNFRSGISPLDDISIISLKRI